jgi:hypothetical protein
MNTINRLVAILLIVVALAIVALVVVAPRQAFDLSANFFQTLSKSSQTFTENNWPVFATGRVIGGIVLGLVGLTLLWLEFRRPRKKIIRAQKLEGGESFIAVEAISQRLAYSIDRLPDIVTVMPRVLGFGRAGLDLELNVETSPEIEVPMKTEEILQVTREVITQKMGLKLGKVQVKIKHAPYPKE